MAHSRLNAIWAKYIISPNPLSGAPSLHDTCLALTKHSLQLTDIVGFGAGFKLHPDLAQQVSEVSAAMDSLLRPAARHHFGESSFYIGSDLPYVLTGFLGERLRAQQWQIISHWVMLLDRLEIGMQELKNLCLGDPRARTHRDRPSPYPRLVASLSPILQVTLRPCDFELWGMAMPLTVRKKAEIARTTPSESQLPATETVRSKIRVVLPPERSPPMDTSDEHVTTGSGSETAAADSVFASAALEVANGDVAPLRKLPVEDARIREETVIAPQHAPVAAIPAAVKDPPRDPITSTPGVEAITSCSIAGSAIHRDSVLAPQESVVQLHAPPGSSSILHDIGFIPQERSSGTHEAGELGDRLLERTAISATRSERAMERVVIGLRGNEDMLAVQRDERVSNHAPATGSPAAVKDPSCDDDIGGLEGNSNSSARSIPVPEGLTTPTSGIYSIELAEYAAQTQHLQTSGSTVSTGLASLDSKATERSASARCTTAMTSTASAVCEARSLAPGLVVDGAAVEHGGLTESMGQKKLERARNEARTTEETSRVISAVSPSLARALPKAPAVHSPSTLATVARAAKVETSGPRRVYGTGKDASTECALLPPSPLQTVELEGPKEAIISAAYRQFPSTESPAPAPSFEGGPVELGGLDGKVNERKDENATRDVHTVCRDARVNINTPSPPVLVMDICKAKAWALVSAMVRTTAATYLARVRRGELAPCLAWAREGIGTVRAES
ncbi:hypothetical protein C8R47DRAFT_1211793 [Mycena vitilis]|nr:hypothetical protein C8R47DRAFT_1211793 [Mycena vitilis]